MARLEQLANHVELILSVCPSIDSLKTNVGFIKRERERERERERASIPKNRLLSLFTRFADMVIDINGLLYLTCDFQSHFIYSLFGYR